MSYNKYTWQTGETITAEKLNNLEEGVQEALEGDSSVFYVDFATSDGQEWTANKTYAEIMDAYNGGSFLVGRCPFAPGVNVLISFVEVGNGQAIFRHYMPSETGILFGNFIISVNDEVTVEQITFTK